MADLMINVQSYQIVAQEKQKVCIIKKMFMYYYTLLLSKRGVKILMKIFYFAIFNNKFRNL